MEPYVLHSLTNYINPLSHKNHMNIFGIPLTVTNAIGFYSFISIIFLVFLYLMKPKPFKKIIPSIIFLESNKKKQDQEGFLAGGALQNPTPSFLGQVSWGYTQAGGVLTMA